MVVSVVTRGVSDDANAFLVADRSVSLRISRLGHVYAFHASTDATTWQLVRVFTLGDTPADTPADTVAGHRIGFEAQSPTGDGCTVTFDRIGFVAERLQELRDGS
jgi:regulation of enolase protein 1 (concanavalin A-like superfamily)